MVLPLTEPEVVGLTEAITVLLRVGDLPRSGAVCKRDSLDIGIAGAAFDALYSWLEESNAQALTNEAAFSKCGNITPTLSSED